MKHIITEEEVKLYGRAMSAHIDKKTLESLIKETEDMDIRPALGAEFLASLLNEPIPTAYTTLLMEGGYYPNCYTEDFNPSEESGERYFAGLKKTVAYYVQAKLVKTNDNQITRFGVMQKDSEYGYRPSQAERNDQYNDLAHIADIYLRETLDFLRVMAPLFPIYQKCNNRVVNNRTVYRIIGD